MKHLPLLLRLAAAAAALPVLSGCTLLGLGIGAGYDYDRMTPRTPAEVPKMAPKNEVEVQFADGTSIAGKYLGLATSPLPEYAVRYDEARAALGDLPTLPRLGKGATFRLVGGAEQGADLLGFDPWGARVTRPRSAALGTVSFVRIVGLRDASGTTVDGASLTGLARERRVPCLSVLHVQTRSGEKRDVPLDQVAALVEREKGHRRRKGLLIGAALDTALILIVVGNLQAGW